MKRPLAANGFKVRSVYIAAVFCSAAPGFVDAQTRADRNFGQRSSALSVRRTGLRHSFRKVFCLRSPLALILPAKVANDPWYEVFRLVESRVNKCSTSFQAVLFWIRESRFTQVITSLADSMISC
jgi:hypothetical protein